MKPHDGFVLHQQTMALLPCEAGDGRLESLVLEVGGLLRVARTPRRIIDDSACYYGCSYLGLKHAAGTLGYRSMPPVCLSTTLELYFFPLMSDTQRGCIWLAHSHIKGSEAADKDRTRVFLTCGEPIIVSISYHVFSNKNMRTALYRHQIRERARPYQPAVGRNERRLPFYRLRANDRGLFSIDRSAQMAEAGRSPMGGVSRLAGYRSDPPGVVFSNGSD